MKEIWPVKRIYDHLKNCGYPVPKQAYCTKDFSWKEILIRQTEIPDPAVLENLAKVTQTLQKYRMTVFRNSPTIITSGWRSKTYNVKIGGAKNSYHIKGMALDFVVTGFTPKQTQIMLDPVHKGGLEFAPAWTHIDSGSQRRFCA